MIGRPLERHGSSTNTNPETDLKWTEPGKDCKKIRRLSRSHQTYGFALLTSPPVGEELMYLDSQSNHWECFVMRQPDEVFS